MAKWLEKEVLSLVDGALLIEEWQSARCSACGKYHTTPYMYYFDEYNFCPNCGEAIDGKDEPRKLSSREWKEFLAKQFGISKTSAKEMLHGMMRWKSEDNFKRTFNPIKEKDDEFDTGHQQETGRSDMENEMSMISMQTDQLRELAARSEDRELINALHGAAETIENLILKNEALPKVIATYPDGTIVVRVEDLEKAGRVMVESGHYCKMFYEEHLVQVSDGTGEETVK